MQFDKDINSPLCDLFLKTREFLLKNIPDVVEEHNEHITSYKIKLGMYCYIKVKNDYLHIGWGRGASIEDKYKKLFGTGSIVRGQKVLKLDKETKESIKYYINETTIILIEHDEKKRMRNYL